MHKELQKSFESGMAEKFIDHEKLVHNLFKFSFVDFALNGWELFLTNWNMNKAALFKFYDSIKFDKKELLTDDKMREEMKEKVINNHLRVLFHYRNEIPPKVLKKHLESLLDPQTSQN